MIAISMYQRFGASDISPIKCFGVSIEFRPTLPLLSDTDIGRVFINADIAKTVLISTGVIYDGVGPFELLF